MPTSAVGVDAPAGFLERFARRGGRQRFAGLEMPGRLVQPRPGARFLLDQQEAAVALDDGRDGDGGTGQRQFAHGQFKDRPAHSVPMRKGRTRTPCLPCDNACRFRARRLFPSPSRPRACPCSPSASAFPSTPPCSSAPARRSRDPIANKPRSALVLAARSVPCVSFATFFEACSWSSAAAWRWRSLPSTYGSLASWTAPLPAWPCLQRPWSRQACPRSSSGRGGLRDGSDRNDE